MTDLLIDLASYQAGIDLSRPAFDAWNRVNIKTSQGNWYVANRQRSRAWADQARALGKGISTFHWLDMSTSGAEQARIAYQEMRNLGGPDGMAHQADTEDDGRTYGPMTYRVWRDYVNAMQDLMGRHVINYTGDWWWPGGWDGASVTPYLMAAANVGYFNAYPGDGSPHWTAGYGGWDTLAAMQFRVGPIPNGGPGAGSVSMTAIRDPQVWAALTGGHDMPLTPADITAIKAAVCGGPGSLTIDQLQQWLGDGVDTRGGSTSAIAPRPSLALVLKTLETLSTQTGGAPTQEQVDAAMLKALSDPSVITALGAAVASHIHVS